MPSRMETNGFLTAFAARNAVSRLDGCSPGCARIECRPSELILCRNRKPAIPKQVDYLIRGKRPCSLKNSQSVICFYIIPGHCSGNFTSFEGREPTREVLLDKRIEMVGRVATTFTSQAIDL